MYFSLSYYTAPKDIRFNRSHFCLFDFSSNNEKSLICGENNISKQKYAKAIEEPFPLIESHPRNFIGT